MHFRMEIIHLCIDIEHDLKVKILQEVETNPRIDGYSVVNNFLASNKKNLKKIAANCSSPFTCDLIRKYFTIEEQIDSITNKKVNNISKYDDCFVFCNRTDSSLRRVSGWTVFGSDPKKRCCEKSERNIDGDACCGKIA